MDCCDGRLIIVDAGGSGVKVYQLETGICCREETHKWRVKDSKEEVILQIVKREHARGEILLGIPGPVGEGEDKVFCPPLDTTLDVARLRQYCKLVTNDVVAQVGRLVQQKPYRGNGPNALVTIGTSLGLAVFEWKGEVIETVRAARGFEIAHEPLPQTCRKLLPLASRNHQGVMRMCELYSAGGFCERWVGRGESIGNYIRKSDRHTIESAIQRMMEDQDESYLERWLESLMVSVSEYTRRQGIANISLTIVDGGLIKAFANAGLAKRVSRFFMIAS